MVVLLLVVLTADHDISAAPSGGGGGGDECVWCLVVGGKVWFDPSGAPCHPDLDEAPSGYCHPSGANPFGPQGLCFCPELEMHSPVGFARRVPGGGGGSEGKGQGIVFGAGGRGGEGGM